MARDIPSHRLSNQLAKALELIDGAQSIEEAQRRLRAAISTLDRRPVEDSSSTVRARGRSYFDQLIAQMLDQVKRAESREALIEDTLHALADDPETRAGICYLVLEGFVRPDGIIVDIRVAVAEAVNPHRLQNFKRDRLQSLADSPFFRSVLVDRETHEFLPTNFLQGISYFGEFDQLVDMRARGAWICALPLPPADANRPSRLLVVIYPIVGPEASPALPRGAMQEWRSLTFLRVAYEMLNHQLASTSEIVAQQRRDILADLGPGLVNHEINQQLRVLDESANLINWGLRQLETHVPADNLSFDAVVDGLVNVLSAVDRLHHIADAFNNLERRPTQEPVSIAGLIEEITTLLNYKMARAGAKLTFSGDTQVELVTDASLIEQVVINVLANALDAIEEVSAAAPVVPELRIACRSSEQRIEIDILNNGPPIQLTRPERIFEKGFTTKRRGIGHGLGLYLCRVVMTYLGGNITLLETDQLELGFNAGFRLDLPIERKGTDDIASLDGADGSSLARWRGRSR